MRTLVSMCIHIDGGGCTLGFPPPAIPPLEFTHYYNKSIAKK